MKITVDELIHAKAIKHKDGKYVILNRSINSYRVTKLLDRDRVSYPEFYTNSDIVKCILFNDNKPYLCQIDECNNPVKPNKNFCSRSCTAKHGHRLLGKEHPAYSKKTRDKIKKTNISKYGSSVPINSKQVKVDSLRKKILPLITDIIEKSVLDIAKAVPKEKVLLDIPEVRKILLQICDKYNLPNGYRLNLASVIECGVYNNFQPMYCKECSKLLYEYKSFCSKACTGRNESTKRKSIDTQIERYGTLYCMTYEERKRRSIHNPMKDKNTSSKARDTLRKRKAEDIEFAKSISEKISKSKKESSHLSDIYTLLESESFWRYYVDNSYTVFEAVDDISKKYGVAISYSTVERNLKKLNIWLNSYKSRYESEIYRYLNDDLGVSNIICNSRSIIPNKELDIYLPDYKLAIEFNGLYWHSSTSTIDKNRHLEKTQLCESKGIKLLHIFENEWVDTNKADIWKSIISHSIGKTDTKVYARKCKIVEINNSVSDEFIDSNHIQGKCSSSIRVALTHNGEIVSVLTLGKSRFNRDYEYEIIRFCNKKHASVLGGFSKLLKYTTEKYNISSLISYGNRRWCSKLSNVYEINGFILSGVSRPNYFYVDSRNLKVYNRVRFQKHKLSFVLKNFDSSLTEMENVVNNGYRVLYDSGNLVYSRVTKSTD